VGNSYKYFLVSIVYEIDESIGRGGNLRAAMRGLNAATETTAAPTATAFATRNAAIAEDEVGHLAESFPTSRG